jgi:uncharacterized protein DUF4345
MNGVARTVYGTFGVLTIALGALVLIKPALALPPDESSTLAAHLVREQAAGGVFIGVMALWCAFHLERRRPVHFALLLFTALFAAIHWAEYFEDRRQLASPIVNSIPFLAFSALTPTLTRRNA